MARFVVYQRYYVTEQMRLNADKRELFVRYSANKRSHLFNCLAVEYSRKLV